MDLFPSRTNHFHSAVDLSFLVTLASRADLSLLSKWIVFYLKGISAYHLRSFLYERAFYPQYAVIFPSYTDHIHPPGPSGLFHATNFSRAYLPLYERTFSIARASQRESFYVTRSELFTLLKDIFTFAQADRSPITCGKFNTHADRFDSL